MTRELIDRDTERSDRDTRDRGKGKVEEGGGEGGSGREGGGEKGEGKKGRGRGEDLTPHITPCVNVIIYNLITNSDNITSYSH